jgi:predicted ATPase/DNA-binding CsgD family transcriptional regulator/transcriptional regulator with XRE-family HTH domain
MSERETFGRWLKQRRQGLDLTQHALAVQSGCTVETIRKLEAEKRRPSRQLVTRLAETLQIPAADRAGFQQLARGHASAVPCTPLPASLESPVDHVVQTNGHLPVPLTPLIGQEAERAALCDLVRRTDVRLVTLLGPPGIGKTRLGIQVAADLQEAFATGVRFVPLTSLREPSLVIPAMARLLDVREIGGQPLIDTLVHALQGQQRLIVLDNFEHLAAAAPDLAQVLEHAPDLTLLVTSRAALRLTGEHVWAVPPLGLPDPGQWSSYDELLASPAVQLFVQRAQTVHPTFTLTEATAPAVAEICVRLEGVPLAIELAAARSRVLSPQAMLARLDQRLGLLTGGAVNTPARQQSLRAAIAWSYALLPPEGQALFRRLGVFVGGTLAALEAVCQDAATHRGEGEVPLLDCLATLVDQSLLQYTNSADGEPRFTMLETLREFALEQLDAAGETEVVCQRHATYYVHLAEHAAPHLQGPDQAAWLERLAGEHDNLRAALAWCLGAKGWRPHRADHSTAVEMGLRLAVGVCLFWEVRGYWQEGRTWLEAVARQPQGTPALRARALAHASRIACLQSDYAAAAQLAEHSLALARAVNNRQSMVTVLHTRGLVAVHVGNYTQATRLFEDALALARQISRDVGDRRVLVLPLMGLSNVVSRQGDPRRARALCEEGLALAHALGMKTSVAHLLNRLGRIARAEQDYAQAAVHFRQSLQLYHELGDKAYASVVLGNLGFMALYQHQVAQAAAHFAECLTVGHAVGYKVSIDKALNGLGAVAAAQGQPQPAVRLFSAAAALRQMIGYECGAVNQTEMTRHLATLRTHLDPGTFEALWTAGQALPLEAVLAEALDVAQAAQAMPPPRSAPARATYPADLTAREVEVLRLVAQGLTNPQIAAHLCISPRTVHAHLHAIYGKLEVPTRSAATRFAVEHGLD